VLRGLLLTGGDDRYLRHAVAGGGGEPEVAGHALWWPPTKIAGRYLAGYLFECDDLQTVEDIRGGRLEIQLPLDAHAAAGHP
jgi:sulfide:quinone oxidoreductase